MEDVAAVMALDITARHYDLFAISFLLQKPYLSRFNVLN